MNRKIMLKGLDCPHCTAVIEEKISSLPYVSAAVFNPVTKIMDISLDKDSEKLDGDVKKIVAATEPSVQVLDFSENQQGAHADDDDDEGITPVHIIRLVSGLVFLFAAIFFKTEAVRIPLYIVSYVIFGWDVVLKALRNIAKGQIFDENFLMSIATIGAFLTGKFAEAVSVMLFYQIGELFQDMAVGKASRSVKNLLNIMPENANLITEDGISVVPSEKINTGDMILVRPGEKIPLDGIVAEGSSYVDKKALTGESLPEEAVCGSAVLSGEINGSSPLKIKVTKISSDSTAQKIIRLTREAASKKSKAERFITKFAKIYTPVVVFAAVAIALIPLIFAGPESFFVWFDRALIFLVASCPCALVISIPLGFFAGIGRASSRGILIKGSTFVQSLAEADTVVFDKTGTLTEGSFSIEKIEPVGVSEKELLSICASAESLSSHPIAAAISNTSEEKIPLGDYEETSGMGIRAITNDNREILVGNLALLKKYNVSAPAADDSITTVYAAADGKYIGKIVLKDTVKKDSRQTIANLRAKGIKTVLLTGDKKESAEEIGRTLGLDSVRWELLPSDKLSCLEKLYDEGSKTIAYLGDGINDAPVLRRADIGVAMGGLGSDAAIEASDCVIMSDEPSKILEAVSISKTAMSRIRQNTAFVISFKIFVLVISAIGFGNMWLAVFADIGTALLAVLNSIR